MSFLSSDLGGQASTPSLLQASNQGQINNEIASQNALAQQLQTQAAGGGPNPAAQQLKNAVAQNAASNSALAASQRGINPGLAARNAMEANANQNQQAAGTAAQLGQQQALNAQQQLGGLLNTQVGQGLQASQAQGQIDANIAQSNAQNAQSASGGLLGSVGSILGLADGGDVSSSPTDTAIPPPIPFQPSQPSSGNSKSGGGGGGGLGALAALAFLANGGEILRRKFADGNNYIPPALAPGAALPAATNPFAQNMFGLGKSKAAPASAAAPVPAGMPATVQGGPALGAVPTGSVNGPQAPQSFIGKALSGLGSKLGSAATNTGQKLGNLGSSIVQEPGKIASDIGNLFKGSPDTTAMAKGGKVPALVSPGERYLPPSEVKKVEKGEKSPMKAGERIPGKPKVDGAVNSYANDTVKKTLKEGGVVLPRNVTLSSDAEKKAIAFMDALKAKRKDK